MNTLRIFLSLTFLSLLTVASWSQVDLEPVSCVEGDIKITNLPPKDPTVASPPVAPPAAGGEDRIMYMVHGIGGGVDAITHGEVYIRARYRGPALAGVPINTASRQWDCLVDFQAPPYNDFAGVPAGATEVAPQLLDPDQCDELDVDINQNFVFASSYGSLVTRQLYADYFSATPPTPEVRFSGAISFSAPNEGAGLVDNLVPFLEFAVEEGQIVQRAYVEEFIQSIPIVNLRGVLTDISGWVNVISDEIPTVAGRLLPAFPGVADMSPTGAVVTTLNNPALSAPIPNRISIVATEDEDRLAWRFANGIVNSPNALPAFTANTDQPLLDDINSVLGHMTERINTWNARASSTGSFGRIIGWRHFSRSEMRRLSAYWTDARAVITGFDDSYKTFAEFYETTTATVPVPGRCLCIDNQTQERIEVSATSKQDCYIGGCQGGETIWIEPSTRVEVTRQYLPNDGIVTNESAESFGGAILLQNGDNHFQMRNTASFRVNIDRMLNGFSNPWFDCDTE